MKLNFKKQNWYFISSTVKNKKCAFLNTIIRNICSQSFFKTALKNNYMLAAFVLMPEHIHVLSGTCDLNLNKDKMAKNYKGASSRNIFLKTPNLKLDIKPRHFWTKGCNKQNIEGLKEFKKCLNYIIQNPVKKMLPYDYYYLYINNKFYKLVISGPQFQAPNLLGVINK